jgi:hypothetical protein
MASKYADVRARRVVTGLDEHGRSAIVSDGVVTTRVVTDAFTINQLWQATAVPPPVSADSTLGSEVTIPPPPNGFVFSVTTFPPDSDWDFAADYADALAASGAEDSFVEGTVPGLHEIDSVDIITVISGEVYAVVETGEALLKAGDTIVQRGTRHTWRNRSDEPCVIAAFAVGAQR